MTPRSKLHRLGSYFERTLVNNIMAAPSKSDSSCWSVPKVYKHHEQKRVCISRSKYREGRTARAVKVYTINLESRYLMVQGVPAIGVMRELIQLCALYGVVEEYRPLDEYPAEEFTEVYLVKFQKLTSARAAKRRMDEKSFYGGVLHVCYVPEYETVEDTRLKLQDRRSYVTRMSQRREREKAQLEKPKETTLSDSATTSDTITKQNQMSNRNTAEVTSSISHYSSFPLLPLPPQEQPLYSPVHQQGSMQTEDGMGTLHNAITDPQRQRVHGSDHTSSSQGQSAESRPPTSHASGVRLIPRITHLENRKRKIQNPGQHLSSVSGCSNVFIGPKLPEPSKLDMEDASLDTTVSLIRNAMKQVESVPDLKPAKKKVKPRRRI
ncbi:RNA-binding protein 48 [Gouania willdenowi]|uniref:RNA-binding protein 48 n=1 Tax=Gouania willdenowi TaxID=441366 RepID=A0A8C5H2J3_GOUWI|nr:RNA-binding protein 48 [Gouania willdenowi]